MAEQAQNQPYTKYVVSQASDITLKRDAQGNPTGEVSFTVATLETPDKHADVLKRGFCGEQKALISQFQHAIWEGAPPVGNGRIYENGDKLLFDGQIDMRGEEGQAFWRAVDFNKELLEVSFGFYITEYSFGEEDGMRVMYVHKADVREVSPVIAGAGVDTGIRSVKDNRPPDNGQSSGADRLALKKDSASVLRAKAQIKRINADARRNAMPAPATAR